MSEAVMARLSGRPLDAGRLRHPASATQTHTERDERSSRGVSLQQARSQARPRMEARPRRAELKPYDGEAILDRLRSSPQRPSGVSSELKRALEGRMGQSLEELPEELRATGVNLDISEALKALREALSRGVL